MKIAENYVPDIFAPIYNFMGIPTAQLAYELAYSFEQARKNINEVIKNFSLLIFGTDLMPDQNGVSAETSLRERLGVLAKYRTVKSVAVYDKDTEEFKQINTSLSNLKELWFANLELLCVPFGIPTIKYLGISPSGFNATGEFDMRNYYDEVNTRQENVFGAELLRLCKMIAATLGIESELSWRWNSLYKPTEKEKSELLKIETEREVSLEGSGILSAGEIREKISKDAKDPYNGIDTSVLPVDPRDNGGEDEDEEDTDITDEDFDESKHPRDEDGKFGSGGNSANKSEKKDASAFGEAFSKYSGKPEKAIDKLILEKSGYVPAAIYKEDIGDIDFVYGEPGNKGTKEGFGISHIIRRRDEEGVNGIEFVKSLPEIIKSGVVVSRREHKDRKYIVDADREVAIRLDYDGEKKNWLVSAYLI